MMKNIELPKIFELVSRYYVFLFLNFYGFGKILGGQFYRKGNLPPEIAEIPLGEVGAYDLAWTFMGYSFWYIFFVGVSQIIGSWLLLWDRTKLLGVVILFPIMLNIIVFDVLFLDTKDALVNATIYFFMLIYILYQNRVAVFNALDLFSKTVKNKIHFKEPMKIFLVIITMAVVFGIDQFFVTLVRNWYH